MIKLLEKTVMTRLPDGTTAPLDLETLRKAIETSFRSTGTERAWLAEDIALSIESSLRSLGEECALTLGEIDSIVVNILRETGFHEAARDYRGRKKALRDGLPLEMERVLPLLSGELAPEDGVPSIESVAARVVDACRVLSIEEAPPALILELGRFYRRALSAETAAPTNSAEPPPRPAPTPWLVERKTILERLSVMARELAASGAISIHGISHIFPEIRIAVDLDRIARSAGLTPPSAEIALYPALSDTADAVAATAETARKLAAEAAPDRQTENLSTRVRALDTSGFAEKWLCASPGETTTCVAEILAEIACGIEGEVLIDPR